MVVARLSQRRDRGLRADRVVPAQRDAAGDRRRDAVESVDLLGAAAANFSERCIEGLTAPPPGPQLVEQGLMLAMRAPVNRLRRGREAREGGLQERPDHPRAGARARDGRGRGGRFCRHDGARARRRAGRRRAAACGCSTAATMRAMTESPTLEGSADPGGPRRTAGRDEVVLNPIVEPLRTSGRSRRARRGGDYPASPSSSTMPIVPAVPSPPRRSSPASTRSPTDSGSTIGFGTDFVPSAVRLGPPGPQSLEVGDSVIARIVAAVERPASGPAQPPGRARRRARARSWRPDRGARPAGPRRCRARAPARGSSGRS